MDVGDSLEHIERFESSIEFSQLLKLQLLQVIVVARHVNATLNDCLDLKRDKQRQNLITINIPKLIKRKSVIEDDN